MTTTGIFTIEGQGLKLDSKEDVAKMCSEIKEIVGLSQVHLQGNTIGVGAAEALASAIKLHDSVKIVNLSDIFTGRLKEIVPVCLDFFVDALINQVLLY